MKCESVIFNVFHLFIKSQEQNRITRLKFRSGKYVLFGDINPKLRIYGSFIGLGCEIKLPRIFCLIFDRKINFLLNLDNESFQKIESRLPLHS